MDRDGRRPVGGTRRGRCARHATDDTSVAEPRDDVARLGSWSPVARDWLLITVSTPGGGSSTLRVYAWRNLRSLGAHYLQQSVCLLPGDAEDHARRDPARDTPPRRGRPRRDASHPPDGLQAGDGGHRCHPARADRRVPRGGREHAAVPRGASARAPPRPGHVHRTRGVRRRPRPPSEMARRDPRPRLLRRAGTARRPPRPSRRARRRSPDSRAMRCPRSSTSPRRTRGSACARSTGPTADKRSARESATTDG